jgi:hypothetical protein
MHPTAALTPGQKAFVPMLEASRPELEALVVPGVLLTGSPWEVVDEAAVVFPKPQKPCPHCKVIPEAPLAQFWAHERLWRINFCPHWFEADHYPDGWVVSAGAEDGLTIGQPVVGSTTWAEKPWRFVMDRKDPRRMALPVMQDLNAFVRSLDDEDRDDFEVALAHVVDAQAPAVSYTAGRLGGAESAIQHTHEKVLCPTCAKPLSFLGQLDEDCGFSFADVGACYFFACLDHPEHTHFDAQTH